MPLQIFQLKFILGQLLYPIKAFNRAAYVLSNVFTICDRITPRYRKDVTGYVKSINSIV